MRKTVLKLLFLLTWSLCGLTAMAAGPDTVRIVFIGDVMSHSPQVTAALKPGHDRSDPRSFDYSSYFSHVRDRFDAADFTVANMEFPCGIAPYTGYPQFSAPRSLAEEAARSGIDLFLTANNHICDKGARGMDSTYVIYSRMGIPFTGFYRSEGEEYETNPMIIAIKGIRVAFINFTYGTNGIPVPKPYHVGMLDSVHVKEVISRARERGAELLVAMPHWGDEYHLMPNEEQRRWVKMLFRCGVDAVIGGHPHVVQPASFYPPKVTVYSLGNYISNQDKPNTRIGMLYEMTVVRGEDGKVEITDGFPTYLWCSRRGMLEKNYTVIPILDWIGRRDEWIDKSDYDTMVREWEGIKKKFGL